MSDRVSIQARTLRVVHRRGSSGQRLVDLEALSREAGLPRELVQAYLAHGLIEPRGGSAEAPLFSHHAAGRLACAARLQHDLGLNPAGAVLACELLERIDELEDRLLRHPRPL